MTAWKLWESEMFKNLLLAIKYAAHQLWRRGEPGGVRGDFREADLRGADLSGAYLRGADLSGAYLSEARYSLLTVLAANWDNVSNSTCVEMMRWDAAAHPFPGKFQEWKEGGVCPINSAKIVRLFSFRERRSLYQAGPPTMTLWELWEALAVEKGIKI